MNSILAVLWGVKYRRYLSVAASGSSSSSSSSSGSDDLLGCKGNTSPHLISSLHLCNRAVNSLSSGRSSLTRRR